MARRTTKPAATGKKEVATTTSVDAGALAEFDPGASGVAAGLENVTAKDLLIPRLTILQALSPQLDEASPEFIPNAKIGDFCDTGTGETWRDSITLIPVYFVQVYLEWAPRSTGKGLIANHGTDSSILQECTQDERRRWVTESGNYIAETATWYVLNVDARFRRSFLPLSSTQMKASRKWLTLITNERVPRKDGSEFTPPMFFRSWQATKVKQQNQEGNWWGWKFDPAANILELDPTKAVLHTAREFYEQVREGAVTGDVASMAKDKSSAAEEADADGEM